MCGKIQKLDFYKGVDISSLPEMEKNGLILYNEEGQECDALALCLLNGVNSVRLRIWNEPHRIRESGGYCDLEHTAAFARRIKNNNLHFLLDFHYSDFWADPGNQTKPAAWEGLCYEELVQAVYDYTKDVLERLNSEGCLPDMVQIGNEIRSGMLFPDGEVPHYKQLVGLVNAGIHAVHDVNPGIQVMIHLDQGGRYCYLREWFDAMFETGLEQFDVIGLSFYPFWHGTFTDLRNTMEALAEHYDKPIILVETAHPWRRSKEGFITREQEEIAGFRAGIEEQSTVMRFLMNITASVKNRMGLGVYYWEPLVLPMEGQGAWGQNMGMLDLEGKALPAFKEFLFDRTKLCGETVAKLYHLAPIMIKAGDTLSLPQEISVLRYDGYKYPCRVEWDSFCAEECGKFRVKGHVLETNEETWAEVAVVSSLPEHVNIIKNADFYAEYENWMIVKRPEQTAVVIDQQEGCLQVDSRQNFFFAITQEVLIQQAGVYTLSVMYRGTNTTGVDVRLYGEQVLTEKIIRKYKNIYPTDDKWVEYKIDEIRLEEGTFFVGVEIKSPPVTGKIKGFQLYKKNEE